MECRVAASRDRESRDFRGTTGCGFEEENPSVPQKRGTWFHDPPYPDLQFRASSSRANPALVSDGFADDGQPRTSC